MLNNLKAWLLRIVRMPESGNIKFLIYMILLIMRGARMVLSEQLNKSRLNIPMDNMVKMKMVKIRIVRIGLC